MIEAERLDRVCILRLAAPPLNTISLDDVAQLRTQLHIVRHDDALLGVVIASAGPHFSAGVDVKLFHQLTTAADAVQLCQQFQSAFQEIEDFPKPIVVALHGTVIGGAVELAMACHYRCAGERCQITMPEVKLGINPGAGGTQRLPRLVGLPAALRMLLDAETIPAQDAFAMGLVDQVLPEAEVVEGACQRVRQSLDLRRTSQLTVHPDTAAAQAAVFRDIDARLAQTHPELQAPGAIVAAIRAGVDGSFADGLEMERQGFAQCMQSAATRNTIDLFFATRRVSKLPELAGIVRRLQLAYFSEALCLLRDEANPTVIDRAAHEFGFTVGPLVLLDRLGLDILTSSAHVGTSPAGVGAEVTIAAQLMAHGCHGKHTGAGIYRYRDETGTPSENEMTMRVVAGLRSPTTKPSVVYADIAERLVMRLILAASATVADGSARRVRDVDVASVMSVGFPDFRGGVCTYARQAGLSRIRARCTALADRVGTRFSPRRLIQTLEGGS